MLRDYEYYFFILVYSIFYLEDSYFYLVFYIGVNFFLEKEFL